MCPTCGVTMQRVNEGVNPVTWWCPRCGTLKMDKGVPDHEKPWRCRAIDWEAVEREFKPRHPQFLEVAKLTFEYQDKLPRLAE